MRTPPPSAKTSDVESADQRGGPALPSSTGLAWPPGAIVDSPPARGNATALLSGAHAGSPVTAGGTLSPASSSRPRTTGVNSVASGAHAMSVVRSARSPNTGSGVPPVAGMRNRRRPLRKAIVVPSSDHAGLATSRSPGVSVRMRPLARSSHRELPRPDEREPVPAGRERQFGDLARVGDQRPQAAPVGVERDEPAVRRRRPAGRSCSPPRQGRTAPSPARRRTKTHGTGSA